MAELIAEEEGNVVEEDDSEPVITEEFDSSTPKTIDFPEHYLTKEATFFDVKPTLDVITNELQWPSTVEVDKNKYLILKNANHQDYDILISQKIKEGGVITEDNGKEYVEFKDKEVGDNIYEKDAKKKERQENMSDIDKLVDDAEQRKNDRTLKESSERIETNDATRSLVNNLAKGEKNPVKRFSRILAEAIGYSTYNEIYQQVKQHENQVIARWMQLVDPVWTRILDDNEEFLKNTTPLDRESMKIYEQIAEQLLHIAADAHIIAPIMVAPMHPALKGYTLGFLNTGLKQTFAEARIKGDVDTAAEYFDIFKKHALADAHKSGVILGATFWIPGKIGTKNFLAEHIILPYVVFETFSALYGERITWEKLAVDGGVFAVLGSMGKISGIFKPKRHHRLFEKNTELIENAIKDGKLREEIIKEVQNDPTMLEDYYSYNKTKFRSRKEMLHNDIETYYKKNQKEFESYQGVRKKIKTHKEIEQAKIDKLVEEAAKKPKVLKTDKEKIEKLETELKNLKENPQYLPAEFGPERAFLLHTKADIIAFNKQLRVEVQDLLIDLKTPALTRMQEDITAPAKTIKAAIEKAYKKIINIKWKTQEDYFKSPEKWPISKEMVLYGDKANPITIKTDRPWTENFMINWFDKMYPFHQISNTIRKHRRGEISMEEKQLLTGAEELQLQSRAVQIADSFINRGQTNFAGEKYARTGEGLKEILKEIDTPYKLKQFDHYLIARRVLEMYEKNPNVETILTKNEAQKLYNDFHPHFKGVAEKIYKYQDNLLVYLHEANVLSKQGLKAMRELNKNYVPWYTVKELSANPTTFLRNQIKDPFKKQAETGEKIVSPVEAIYKNTFHFVELAHRNNALLRFLDEVAVYKEKYGKDIAISDFHKDIAGIKKFVSKKEQKIKEKIEKKKEGVEGDKGEFYTKDGVISGEFAEIMMEKGLGNHHAILGSSKLRDNQVAVYRKGQLEIWEMPEPYIKGLRGSEEAMRNWAVRFLQAPIISPFTKITAKTLRTGVTADPVFLFRNLIKDATMSSIYSKNWAVPLYHTYKGLFAMMSKDPKAQSHLYERWVELGGPLSNIAIDRTYMKNRMLDEITARPIKNQIIEGFENLNLMQNAHVQVNRAAKKIGLPILRDKLRHIQDLSESPGRVGEFVITIERLKKKYPGLSEKQIYDRALYESRNLMDFTQSGLVGGVINQHAAFFNASLRGTARIGEAIKQRPWKTASYIAMTQVLPSIGLWFKNHNDPKYRALPRWKKDLFWCYPIRDDETGETLFFMYYPKTWELGLLFATGTERLLDFLFVEHKDDFQEEYLSFVYKTIYDYVEGTGVRAFGSVGTVAEIFANHDTRLDMPIIPKSVEGTTPYLQSTIHTTETAKMLAKVIRKATFEVINISPITIDKMGNAVVGQSYNNVLSIVEGTLAKAGIITDIPGPDQPTLWSEIINHRLFTAFIETADLKKGGEPVTRMFEIQKKYNRHIEDEKLAQRRGDLNLHKEIMKRPEYSLAQQIDTFMRTNVYPIYKAIKLIEYMPEEKLSGAEKRQQLDQAFTSLHKMAELFQNLYRKELNRIDDKQRLKMEHIFEEHNLKKGSRIEVELDDLFE